MSRDHARVPTNRTRSAPAAVGCVLALSAGCRFATSPSEPLLPQDAGVRTTPTQLAAGETPLPSTAPSVNPPATSTLDAGVTAATATSHTAPTAGSSAPEQLVAGSAGSASALAGAKASSPPPQAAANPAHPMETECSAALAGCLLRDPLAYAECLRANQDKGCADLDAGVPATSPITTEDGKPLSQACQAELASCIARLPTPENAEACTEKARTCK